MVTMKIIDAARDEAMKRLEEYRSSHKVNENFVGCSDACLWWGRLQDAREVVEALLREWWKQGCKERPDPVLIPGVFIMGCPMYVELNPNVSVNFIEEVLKHLQQDAMAYMGSYYAKENIHGRRNESGAGRAAEGEGRVTPPSEENRKDGSDHKGSDPGHEVQGGGRKADGTDEGD